ncbi:DUF4834 family protein [Arenibacter sp. GZD96]|uniref:DUF4834 family protein n=1 Tax=Aurantibrevibacter litoralis TaxID=3106030 RepID=UPI002AFE5761|nr:DUF4834 family protein [Arenibacter sp. GZD-96]MEA1787465.1 DUF4834 family protein [Arenibacter sp. GZD-96]
MISFITTVLIILLVYYFFKILAKWLAPKILAYVAQKAEARIREQFGTFNSYNTPEKDEIDDISIDKKPAKKYKTSKKVGEYIDFEEIE